MNKIMRLLVIMVCFIIEGLSIYNHWVSFYYGVYLESIIDINVKRPIVDEEILNSINNYDNLKKVILNASINTPIDKDLIPQGIEIVKSKIFITGYYENNENSKCYVLDKSGNVRNIVTLDNNSHVGSIAYDEVNDLIWIPGNDGLLNAYKREDFIKKKEVEATYQFSGFSLDLKDYKDKNKLHIAYIYIDNDNLYFGNFFINKSCIIKKYKIVKNGNMIDLQYVQTFTGPEKVQGMTLYKKDNQEYLILSKSYGRHNSSQIYVYHYDEEIVDYNNLEIKVIDLPPMLEQISLNNNKLYLLFESGANKYYDCEEKLDVIPVIDIDELLRLDYLNNS